MARVRKEMVQMERTVCFYEERRNMEHEETNRDRLQSLSPRSTKEVYAAERRAMEVSHGCWEQCVRP
jgi:hypothetical protein